LLFSNKKLRDSVRFSVELIEGCLLVNTPRILERKLEFWIGASKWFRQRQE
jgi:hypothetical protein